MRFADLDGKTFNPNIVLLQTPSTKLSMFIEDKLKRKVEANRESIITIETKADYAKIKNVIGIVPPNSKKWFVELNLDKHYNKDMVKLLKNSTTCLFFCTCSKYGTFKKFKDEFSKTMNFYDMYINYLKRPDLVYLYDAFVKSDNKLSKQLFDYVAQGYSSDIEAVFDLLLALNSGQVITSRKDISDICGIGGLSVETLIFSLIKPLSGSDKGLHKVLKNRIQAGTELGASLSYRTFYNYMHKSLRTLCELKQLMIAGVVYKSVHNLPDSYNEKDIAKYQKYIWRLREIPLSKLLRIINCMGSQWQNELDFVQFIYRYYYEESILLINGGSQ